MLQVTTVTEVDRTMFFDIDISWKYTEIHKTGHQQKCVPAETLQGMFQNIVSNRAKG